MNGRSPPTIEMKRRQASKAQSSSQKGDQHGPKKKEQGPTSTPAWRRILLVLILLVILVVVSYFAAPTRFSGPKQSSQRAGKAVKANQNPEDENGVAPDGPSASKKDDDFKHSGKSCEKLMDEARHILEYQPRSEWEHALDLLASCVLQEPNNAAPRWNLAVALIQMNRVEEAVIFIDEALELEPNNLVFLRTGGALLSKSGYHAAAIKCLELYLEVSLQIASWEELLASISVQREDEWMFLYDAGDDVIRVFELLQTSYLHESSLIKAGYLYKVLIGLKGKEAEVELLGAYSFFAFGLGDISTGIKYLRLYTEKQYISQKYGDEEQAYEVVTAHSLRLLTSGFDSHIASFGKNLLMGSNTVWDELVYNCELSEQDYLNYTEFVRQSDLKRIFVKCLITQNIVSSLLEDGAVEYAENIFGWTPLLHSAALGSADIVNQLLVRYADPQSRTVLAHTALHIAAMKGTYDVVPPLVQNGLSPTEVDYFNRTALSVACLHGWTAKDMANALSMKLPSDCPTAVIYSPPPRLSPQGGWMASGVALPPELMKERCDFDVMKVPDTQTFVFDYMSLQRPVLIRNATNSHVMKKLFTMWQHNKFEQEFGDLKFNEVEVPYAEAFGYSSTTKTTAKAFVSKMKQYNEQHKQLDSFEYASPSTYIFETIPSTSPLLKEFELPEVLNPNLTHIEPTKIQFYIGPPMSGAPMHFHRNAWNVLFYGQKRWFLYPPDRAFYSKVHVWDWWKKSYRKNPDAMECVQYPGDLVYVPDMWGHAVINVRESIGLASEFVYGASEFSI